jgi:hypothetical protein
MVERIPYYDDLLEAFAKPGCAVCRQLSTSADKLIDSILYEGVNDVPTRDAFNKALGYCLPHSQLMIRAGAALGVTIMVDNILKILLRALDANPVDKMSASRRKQFLRNLSTKSNHADVQKLVEDLSATSVCPICVNEAEMFGHYGRTFLKHMAPDNTLCQAYEQSDGLCLPHFRGVIALSLPGPALNALVQAQQNIWLRLHEQAEVFIRKNDHRFRGKEPFGEEKDVWLRALTAVSGAPIKTFVDPKGLTQ